MKITFEQGDLYHALTLVKGICGNLNTLPILSCVLIKGGNGTVEITGNNLEVSIEVKTPAVIESEGEVVVSAGRLLSLVKLLPKTSVFFEAVDDDLQVTCEGDAYNLIGMDTSDYPIRSEIEGETFTISCDLLKTLLRQTEFAASVDEVRYTLHTVYFNKSEVVATDGTRFIAKAVNPIQTPQFLLPLDTVRELRKSLNGLESDVTVVVGNSSIRFETEDIALTSRLVEGEYPPYHKVIPQKYWTSTPLNTDTKPVGHTHSVSVCKSDFEQAIKRASVFATNKQELAVIEVDENQVSLNTKDIEAGDSVVSVACSCSGEGMARLGINASALLDVISHIESESVVMEFGNPLSPILFKPADSDDFICMIMPMRLESEA